MSRMACERYSLNNNRTEKMIDSEILKNRFDLVLAPFQPTTRVVLEVSLNKEKSTTSILNLRNPRNEAVTVKITKKPIPEKCVDLSFSEAIIEAKSIATLYIHWSPKICVTWWDVLKLMDNNRNKYEATLIMRSKDPPIKFLKTRIPRTILINGLEVPLPKKLLVFKKEYRPGQKFLHTKRKRTRGDSSFEDFEETGIDKEKAKIKRPRKDNSNLSIKSQFSVVPVIRKFRKFNEEIVNLRRETFVIFPENSDRLINNEKIVTDINSNITEKFDQKGKDSTRISLDGNEHFFENCLKSNFMSSTPKITKISRVDESSIFEEKETISVLDKRDTILDQSYSSLGEKVNLIIRENEDFAVEKKKNVFLERNNFNSVENLKNDFIFTKNRNISDFHSKYDSSFEKKSNLFMVETTDLDETEYFSFADKSNSVFEETKINNLELIENLICNISPSRANNSIILEENNFDFPGENDLSFEKNVDFEDKIENLILTKENVNLSKMTIFAQNISEKSDSILETEKEFISAEENLVLSNINSDFEEKHINCTLSDNLNFIFAEKEKNFVSKNLILENNLDTVERDVIAENSDFKETNLTFFGNNLKKDSFFVGRESGSPFVEILDRTSDLNRAGNILREKIFNSDFCEMNIPVIEVKNASVFPEKGNVFAFVERSFDCEKEREIAVGEGLRFGEKSTFEETTSFGEEAIRGKKADGEKKVYNEILKPEEKKSRNQRQSLRSRKSLKASSFDSLGSSHYSEADDPFLFGDENWLVQQEQELKKWLNALMTPPEDFNTEETSVDIVSIWQSVRNLENVVAESRESVSARYHSTNTRLNTLRKAALKMYGSVEVTEQIEGAIRCVDKKRLEIKKDKNPHLDIGLQKEMIELFLSYNPLWLRIGLETVYGETLPLKSNNDLIGLTRFLLGRFFCDETIVREHSHPVVVGMRMPSFRGAMNDFLLKTFLRIVLFLDWAKMRKLIGDDPCLFRRSSRVKESRMVLVEFSSLVLGGIGDVTKVLRIAGYVVRHKQSFLEEFDYGVVDLGLDLRDGVRLCKLMEIVMGKRELTRECSVPAISKVQRVHNVKIAMETLLEGYSISGDIEPKSIAEGDRIKTLFLLWQIIYKVQAPRFEKAAACLQNWWRRRIPVLRMRRDEEERKKEMEKERKKMEEVEKNGEEVINDEKKTEEVDKNKKGAEKQQEKMGKVKNKWEEVNKDGKEWEKQQKKMQEVKNNSEEVKIDQKTMEEVKKDGKEVKNSQNKMEEANKNGKEVEKDQKKMEEANKNGKELEKEQKKMREVKNNSEEVNKNEEKVKKDAKKTEDPENNHEKVNKNPREEHKVKNNLETVIFLQKFLKTRELMLNQKEQFQKVTKACSLIESRENEKRKELERQKSAILIQTTWRKSRKEKMEREEKSAIKIQRFWRRFRVAKQTRHIFLKKKSSAVVIQRRWRQILRERREREAICIQRKWRAWKMMRRDRGNFLKLKNAVRVVEENWIRRRQLPERGEFLKKRESAIVVQKFWRRCVIARRERRDFLRKKAAVILVENKWRAQLLGRKVREDYEKVRNAAVRIQKFWRTILEKREKAILNRCRKIDDGFSTKTLSDRLEESIDIFKVTSDLGRLSMCLASLDLITRLSNKGCIVVCNVGLVDRIYETLDRSNRSLPWLEACLRATSILINLVKFPPTKSFVLKENYIESLTRCLTITVNKEIELFLHLATLFWILIDDQNYAQAVLNNSRAVWLLKNVEERVTRKKKKIVNSGEKLPSSKPDWGLEQKEPRLFSNIYHAIISIKKRLETTKDKQRLEN